MVRALTGDIFSGKDGAEEQQTAHFHHIKVKLRNTIYNTVETIEVKLKAKHSPSFISERRKAKEKEVSVFLFFLSMEIQEEKQLLRASLFEPTEAVSSWSCNRTTTKHFPTLTLDSRFAPAQQEQAMNVYHTDSYLHFYKIHTNIKCFWNNKKYILVLNYSLQKG